jgi:metallo-beta-lactamase class B
MKGAALSMNFPVLLLAAAVGSAVAPSQNPVEDHAIQCPDCAEWNQPQKPFKLHGRSYYVGVKGLSSVLIQTSDGLILLDGGLPQSAPLIETNIRGLGFKVEDIKLIVNSHAHYDHAGGLARLQRDSGAEVAASPSGAEALMAGGPVSDDPQYGAGGKDGAFPKVAKVRVLKDGEAVRIADTAITAHFTPGHTPGSTTWTWSSCAAGECLNIVYADSLTPVSSGDFRFEGISESFRGSLARVAALPCDIMLSTHPGASGLFERLERRRSDSAADPLIDKRACRAYAEKASRSLDDRLKKERAQAAK